MPDAKHVLVVFTESRPGQEDEFNRWYNEVHVKDLLAIDGIEAVQRFQLSDVNPAQPAPHRWLGVYEISADPQDVMAALVAGRDTRAPNSPAYDSAKTVRWYYTAITDRLTPQQPS
jgi:hypothetical protein